MLAATTLLTGGGGGGAGTALLMRELGAISVGRPLGPARVEAMRTGCVDSEDVTRSLEMAGSGARAICLFSCQVVQFGSHLQPRALSPGDDGFGLSYEHSLPWWQYTMN